MKKEDGKFLIVFLTMYLAPLAGMGIDIYTPSLPHMVEYFGSSASSIKATLAIYLLGYGIAQPFFGTASDTWGRKKPLIFGLILYVLAAFLCTQSPNVGVLILFRFLQGIAVAASGAISKSIMADSFEGKVLVTKTTYMNMAWSLGPIVAPGIGGYLEYYIGWQANFYFLVFYALLGLILVAFFLKETNLAKSPFRLKETVNAYREMLSHKLFIGAGVIMAICYGMIVLFNIVGPFVIQVELNHNSIVYGHVAFVMGFAFFLGTLSNRFLLRKKEGHEIVPIGISLILTSSLLMCVLAFLIGINMYVLTIPVFINLYGCGFLFPNLMGRALGIFRGRGGTSAALMGSLFVSGTAVISLFASLLKTHSLVPISFTYLGFGILVFFLYRFTVCRS